MAGPLRRASDRDKRIVRLIQKWLKAGVLDKGIVVVEKKGTGQGAVISPLLANVYLHYVFDLWAHRWRRREAKGDVILVGYADDIVVGFQYESDTKAFWDAMRERLRAFSLSLHENKTRLIEFGRFAAQTRERRGQGKPETFNFLGFTFICGKTRAGRFLVVRKSRADRMRAKLGEIKRGTAEDDAPADRRTGETAVAGPLRLARLSCSADELSGASDVP